MRKITVTFSLIIIILLSCSILTKNKNFEESAFVPGDTDVPGWRIMPDKTKTYGRENIGEALKEKSAVYEKYGFRELITAEYTRVDDSEKIINIEIYRLNNSLNAFGIFSFEREFMYNDSNVCGNSYEGINAFFARKGGFYIKVNSNKSYKRMSKDLTAFGEAVCGRIVIEERPLPDYIVLFGNNRLKDVIYRAVELPVLPELNTFFLRKKNISEKTKIVFFAKRITYIDSYKEFSKLLTLDSNPFILINTEKSQVAFRKNSDNDLLFISLYNEWLFGVISAGSISEGRDIINILFDELIEFLNRNR